MDIPKTVKWTLKIEMMSYFFIYFYFLFLAGCLSRSVFFSRGITGLGSSKYELTLEQIQVWKKPLYEWVQAAKIWANPQILKHDVISYLCGLYSFW